MQRKGTFREMKRRRAYEAPSERRVREKGEAIRRHRKMPRKRLEREGYWSWVALPHRKGVPLFAFRTNYRFERAERDRQKKAKKDEKLKRQQERAESRRDSSSISETEEKEVPET
jgi:small subunit ribosomal protein S21